MYTDSKLYKKNDAWTTLHDPTAKKSKTNGTTKLSKSKLSCDDSNNPLKGKCLIAL